MYYIITGGLGHQNNWLIPYPNPHQCALADSQGDSCSWFCSSLLLFPRGQSDSRQQLRDAVTVGIWENRSLVKTDFFFFYYWTWPTCCISKCKLKEIYYIICQRPLLINQQILQYSGSMIKVTRSCVFKRPMRIDSRILWIQLKLTAAESRQLQFDGKLDDWLACFNGYHIMDSTGLNYRTKRR